MLKYTIGEMRYMKRLAYLLIALLLMCALPALAEDAKLSPAPAFDAPELSGTAEWPVLRGLQWSMDEDVVLLLEQGRGVELVLRDADAVPRRYEVQTAMQVLGHDADRVIYEFSDEMGLYAITVGYMSKTGETADALVGDILAQLEAAYGAPVISMERGEGWQDGLSELKTIAGWERPVEELGMQLKPGDVYGAGRVSLSGMATDDGLRLMLEFTGGKYVLG